MNKMGEGSNGTGARAERRSSSGHTISPSPDHAITPSPRVTLDELIPSNTMNVDALMARVVALLQENGFDGDLGNLQLALQEALTNAILHGNRSDPAKHVRVSVAIKEGGEVVIVVKDSGCGFDPSRLPDPTSGDNIHREGGRGVYLIRRLMDDVEYSFGDGTALTMRLRVSKRQA